MRGGVPRDIPNAMTIRRYVSVIDKQLDVDLLQ